MRLGTVLLVMAACTFGPAAAPLQAQVSPNGFRTRVQLEVRAAPSTVFDALVHVEEWWSPDHTYSGDARNLSLDPRPGGCFCERLPNGGVEHLRVVYVASGETLRMTGGLGPLQSLGVSGSLTVSVKPTLFGTSLELVYSVGGFSEVGFIQLAPAVQSVLTTQMNRLKAYVETGKADRN